MGSRDKKHSLVLLFIFLCKANTFAILIWIALFDLKLFQHSQKTLSHTLLTSTSPQSRDKMNLSGGSNKGEGPSSTSKETTTKDWFAYCTIKKNMLLPKLYTLENGVAHCFSPSEYESWKQDFVSWSNSARHPGLSQMSKQIIMLNNNNKPQGPITDGPQLSKIRTNTTLQRHVLKIVSDHAGSLLGLPDNAAIDKLLEKEVNLQFHGL